VSYHPIRQNPATAIPFLDKRPEDIDPSSYDNGDDLAKAYSLTGRARREGTNSKPHSNKRTGRVTPLSGARIDEKW